MVKMEAPKNYQPAYEKALADFRSADPLAMAARADARYDAAGEGRGCFLVPYFDRAYAVAYPEGTAVERGAERPASFFTQILLLHYLTTATGSLLKGTWVSFRELPGGLMYEAAFRARSLAPLIEAFGRAGEAFAAAATSVGGERARLGDYSFLFRALPRVPLMCVLWLGDDEMPAEASILFDAHAGDYLPTEDLAALGGTLSGRLLRAVTP
jgi:hypothetical protein